MRLFSLLVLLVTILFSSFFCSDKFDTFTDLGTGVLNDLDSLNTIFDGKFCKDSLKISGSSNFIDSDSGIVSGINRTGSIAIGKWENELSIGYMQFNSDTLNKYLKDINTVDTGKVISLEFYFKHHYSDKFSKKNIPVEIGYCNKKNNDEKLNIDSLSLKSIVQYTYSYDSLNRDHYVDLEKKYITVKNTILKDTATVRYITRYMKTVENGLFPTDTINTATIKSLSSLPDGYTVLLTNIIDSTNDTTYNIGLIKWTITTKTDSSIIYDTIAYDSIASVSSLIPAHLTLDKDSSFAGSPKTDTIGMDTIINGIDITIYANTIIHSEDIAVSKIDTNAQYTINKNIKTTTVNGVTTTITEYDTVFRRFVIEKDLVVQNTTISLRKTFNNQFENPLFWDTTTTTNSDGSSNSNISKFFCLYIRCNSKVNNTLQYLSNPHIIVRYTHGKDMKDTSTKLLKPSYFDNSVFEGKSTPENLLFASGAAGRVARMTVDLTPLRDSLIDFDGSMIYKNIPIAKLTLPIEKALTQNLSKDSIYFNYALLPNTFGNTKFSLDSLIKIINISPRFPAKDKQEVIIDIHRELLDILYIQKTIPQKAYLYLWIPNSQFAHITWDKNKVLPIDFTISNSH